MRAVVMRPETENTPETEAAAAWRWMLGGLYHVASFVTRQVLRVGSWSIQKAEQFERAHPEYDRPRPVVGVPRTSERPPEHTDTALRQRE
jgi:hypothetical protein